jgi:hypothetical protein
MRDFENKKWEKEKVINDNHEEIIKRSNDTLDNEVFIFDFFIFFLD